MKNMTTLSKQATGRLWAKLSRAEDTLTFIRTQYSDDEKAKAADLILDCLGVVAFCRGALGLPPDDPTPSPERRTS